MPIERDIYQMYRDGPYDWLNPIDMFTDFLTDGPRQSWATLSHAENGTPLFSLECLLYQNGVYQHYFVTHTTNDDPTHLSHYLTKTFSNLL